MKKEAILALSAMACITVLEIYALSIGVNGTVLALVLSGLAGLGGYEIGKKIKET